MRRSFALLAIGALGLGACSAAGSQPYSGAVVDGGIAAAVHGAAQESSSPALSIAPESQAAGSPAASVAPGGSGGPLPSALLPGVSLTIEPADGAVFGLPPTVPSGTNLLLFNVADVPYQMTILEKNPSVTDSWDVILACGVTSDVVTVVGSVVAQPGGGGDTGITVMNQGDDLLALIPLAAPPAESAAPSAAATEAPSTAPSEAPSAAPSEIASASPAPSIAAEPTATPAPTCPPGGIAGSSPEASASAAAPSIGVPSAAASQVASSTKPHKSHKPGKPGKSPKPTATPAPTPIAGVPDLTNAAWQLFTVTPPGTLPGQTAAP